MTVEGWQLRDGTEKTVAGKHHSGVRIPLLLLGDMPAAERGWAPGAARQLVHPLACGTHTSARVLAVTLLPHLLVDWRRQPVRLDGPAGAQPPWSRRPPNQGLCHAFLRGLTNCNLQTLKGKVSQVPCIGVDRLLHRVQYTYSIVIFCTASPVPCIGVDCLFHRVHVRAAGGHGLVGAVGAGATGDHGAVGCVQRRGLLQLVVAIHHPDL